MTHWTAGGAMRTALYKHHITGDLQFMEKFCEPGKSEQEPSPGRSRADQINNLSLMNFTWSREKRRWICASCWLWGLLQVIWLAKQWLITSLATMGPIWKPPPLKPQAMMMSSSLSSGWCPMRNSWLKRTLTNIRHCSCWNLVWGVLIQTSHYEWHLFRLQFWEPLPDHWPGLGENEGIRLKWLSFCASLDVLPDK